MFGYLPIMPVNARDKAGTSRDKQGQAGTSRDKSGTSRDKQGQSLSVPVCPCLSQSVPACPCLSLLVLSCPCLSLSVPVCPCLSLSFLSVPMSLSVPAWDRAIGESQYYVLSTFWTQKKIECPVPSHTSVPNPRPALHLNNKLTNPEYRGSPDFTII